MWSRPPADSRQALQLCAERMAAYSASVFLVIGGGMTLALNARPFPRQSDCAGEPAVYADGLARDVCRHGGR